MPPRTDLRGGNASEESLASLRNACVPSKKTLTEFLMVLDEGEAETTGLGTEEAVLVWILGPTTFGLRFGCTAEWTEDAMDTTGPMEGGVPGWTAILGDGTPALPSITEEDAMEAT